MAVLGLWLSVSLALAETLDSSDAGDVGDVGDVGDAPTGEEEMVQETWRFLPPLVDPKWEIPGYGASGVALLTSGVLLIGSRVARTKTYDKLEESLYAQNEEVQSLRRRSNRRVRLGYTSMMLGFSGAAYTWYSYKDVGEPTPSLTWEFRW